MSIEILGDTPQTSITPILNELLDIPISTGDIIHVWKNNVYYLAPQTEPTTRLIIEADISTRMITMSIPMNIIPVDMESSITVDNPTNKYEPWYIFKCENSICLIEKITMFPTSHKYWNNVNIYMKHLDTNTELPPIQIRGNYNIIDIIEYEDKLFVATYDNDRLIINTTGHPQYATPEYTWKKIIIIDILTNTITHTLPTLNGAVFKIDIINNKLIICHDYTGPQKVIWDINNLSADPQIINQSFISYARHNNLNGALIYPYNGWVGANPNFIESDGYQIVNTLDTPMAELKRVDIINDIYYVGLPEPLTKGSELNIYNLHTHELLTSDLFIFTACNIYGKLRPYYISNEHIIFSTPSAIKTYKIEERPADERKNKYATLITNLADKYSLARNIEQEIRKHFTRELLDYKPFEVIKYETL
jgi:hypothetical protein